MDNFRRWKRPQFEEGKNYLSISRETFKRTPRKEVSCVECGEKAEADRKGDWRCLASREVPTHIIAFKDNQPVYNHVSVLTCGARGVTLPNGRMCTTQGPPIVRDT